jgi:outer membrane protein assembly complex protein YaeT
MRRSSCGPARVALQLALILIGPPAARADVGDYLGKPIASIRLETEGRRTIDERLLAIIQMQVGSPLSMLAVRETVAHLFSLGEFEDVRVHATNGGSGVDLLFELSPVHPVHRVLFSGIARVPGADEGRLRRAVAERFGASPAPGRAGDMARLVETELAQRGYRRARVTPRIQLEHAPDRATMVLAVEPGARTQVGAVEVVGAPGLPAPDLLEQLRITTGAPYQADELAARIEAYLTDRRERGYYEARLTATPRFADDDRTVDLTIDASQGPRVRLVFTGDPLPADVREELVPIAREGSTDEDLLEDSTNRIVDYLRAQGYRNATARHNRVETEGELLVSFAVARGPQYRVADVTVTGNVFFPSAALEPVLRVRPGQPFDAARLDADVSTIQELYRRRGFASVAVDASIDPAPPAAAGGADVALLVRIVVVEHAQTIVGAVRVEGNRSVPESELVQGLGLQPGVEFFGTQMALDRDAIQSKYANLGYLSATVDSTPELSGDGGRADIVFTVREGPRILVDHVLIVGNSRTRAETIERELQVKAGEPLGLAAVTETQRRLTALGLFRRTRIAQLAHGDETSRDLLITVEEAPPTTVGYGGGFEAGARIQTDEGVAAEEVEFAPRAFFEITRRNLFGKNRSVNLFARVSLRPQDDASGYGFSEYRLLGTFREPRVFDTAADAFLTATAEQQRRSSFNFARRGFNAEVGRRFTSALSIIGSYQIQRTELFDEKIDEADKLLIDRLFPQVLLSSFSGSAIHDTRDDQLNPATGQYFSANGQFAARQLGSEVGLVKSYFTGQLFRTLPRSNRMVLAASARVGTAVGFARQGVNELPASERFFAGGDTTVRGFALDQLGTPDIIDKNGFPIGGNALIILNSELRVPLVRGLGVVGFLDSGNVFARTADIDLGQLRSAAGFGIRFLSPIVPLRVDVGFKIKRRDIVPGRLEPLNAWHISLGQAF